MIQAAPNAVAVVTAVSSSCRLYARSPEIGARCNKAMRIESIDMISHGDVEVGTVAAPPNVPATSDEGSCIEHTPILSLSCRRCCLTCNEPPKRSTFSHHCNWKYAFPCLLSMIDKGEFRKRACSQLYSAREILTPRVTSTKRARIGRC